MIIKITRINIVKLIIKSKSSKKKFYNKSRFETIKYLSRIKVFFVYGKVKSLFETFFLKIHPPLSAQRQPKKKKKQQQ